MYDFRLMMLREWLHMNFNFDCDNNHINSTHVPGLL